MTKPQVPSRGRLAAFFEGAYREGRKFSLIFVYLWALFALFALHKNILLPEDNLLYGQGFAILNAFVLGKVIYFGESIHIGENFRTRPLIYPVLFKSALFAVLLTCFHLGEEILTGALRGKTAYESTASIAGGTLGGILSLGIIVFVVLIPFFAFRELTRVIGDRQMRALFFVRRTEFRPAPPA